MEETMYLDPYTKHSSELVELLNECISELHPEVQKDYLINILTYPKNKNKTILEVLKDEVKAKKQMEKDFEQKKKHSGVAQ
jgi:hypothetical protein